MLKVWIAGASGQIGRALNDVLDPMQIEALNTDLDELDITDTDEVINFGTVNRPDVIINCTGITDTDECEANPEHAYRVNALGARNLSIVARKCGSKIVQLSTDDVFDGQSKRTFCCIRSVWFSDQCERPGKDDHVSDQHQRIWNLPCNMQRCMQPVRICAGNLKTCR